jgi:hypothetical protein
MGKGKKIVGKGLLQLQWGVAISGDDLFLPSGLAQKRNSPLLEPTGLCEHD